jgi:hypothetical protein
MSEELWLEMAPKECAHGYVRRMAALNFREPNEFKNSLGELFLLGLEQKIGRPKSALLNANSWEYMSGALSWYKLGFIKDSPARFGGVIAGQFLCPTVCLICMEDQESDLGFSYWMRDLRLGLYTHCPIHLKPLIDCTRVKNLSSKSPREAISMGRAIVHPRLQDFSAYEFDSYAVAEYNKFVLALVNGIAAAPFVDIAGFISSAMSEEIYWDDDFLLEAIEGFYPTEWLRARFHGFAALRKWRVSVRDYLFSSFGGYGAALILAVFPAKIGDRFIERWRSATS